jgi:SlyX protein
VSASPPSAPRPDDRRIVELETRIAFLEQTLDDLNEVVIDQSRLIQRLEDRLARLEGRLVGDGDPGQAPMPGTGGTPDRTDLLDERPPHY